MTYCPVRPSFKYAAWKLGFALLLLPAFLHSQDSVPAATGSVANTAPTKGPIEETGEIAGAEFRITIPENWNGGLIMYAHGYEAVSPKRQNFSDPVVHVGASLGYAVAQSKYSVQGWAAREGVLETEQLRRHFVLKYGKTWPTIIAGHSQGGAITFATIEMFPEIYDGALPMCAVGQPALMFFKERVFDMRLLFDYYFPGLPGSVVEFPGEGNQMPKTFGMVTQLIKAEPEKAAKFAKMVNVPGADQLPPVIAFWTEILREMQIRTGGNAFDNRDTIYEGSEDDAKLNREIGRYTSDAKSVEYLSRWVTPTGAISDPVIHVHTIVDQLIPASAEKYYENRTELEGTRDLFVQLWVDRVGHCAINNDEITEALKRLDEWIRTGKPAEPGEITKAPSPKSE